jgi:hypothetical protein
MERERENARPDEFVIPKDLPEVEGKKDAARPVVSGGLRCPFCHSDVRAGASDWCACKSCLARHHEACWKESKVCAACGSNEALAASIPQRDASSRGMWFVLALALVLFFGFCFAVLFRLKSSSSEGPTEPVYALPASAPALPTDKPRTHTRAFFTKTEPHELEWWEARSGSHHLKTTPMTLDGFAELLRQKIQDGGQLQNPPPKEAARILRKVVELYKQDKLDEDVYLMEEAIRRLGVAPDVPDSPLFKKIAQRNWTIQLGPGSATSGHGFEGTEAEFAIQIRDQVETVKETIFWEPTPPQARDLLERVAQAYADAGNDAEATRLRDAAAKIQDHPDAK